MSKPESLLPYYRWKPTKELLKACKKKKLARNTMKNTRLLLHLLKETR